jgi:DNA-binding GntR family transcriptional regulator
MSPIARVDLVPELSEQVYERLLEAICEGVLAPGARLRQEELAANFDVSRQPVLQALRMLKKDGFVIDVGRRGLMVAPVDARSIAQIYEVRSVLDGLAEGRKAVAGSRIGPMIDADTRFHNLLYTASGNPLIAETANHHWRHIRRAMGAVLQTAGVRDSVWDEHEAILKAINRGDAERAERLARAHGESAGHNLAMQIELHIRKAS